MSVLNPIALWALAGLVIPVGIHLLSRKEGKTIRIGSIRFLSETATSKFSSIKLNEVALLLIRCALLISIVLFLAGLLVPSKPSVNSKHWVVVESGLENENPVTALLDSLSKSNYELKKLENGFPSVNEPGTSAPPDYYKLAEELAATGNVEAIVIAKNSLSNFKAARIALPENITWLSYPVSEISIDTISITRNPSADTLNILLAYDEEYRYDKIIISAALKSLNSISPQPIVLREVSVGKFTSPEKTDWLVWLSDSPLTFPGKVLRYQPNRFGNLVYKENKRTWILASRLDERTAIQNHLAIQLMKMLFDHTADPLYAQQRDTRSISDTLAWSKQLAGTAISVKENTQPVNNSLFILITLLFITERAFAFYRKQ